MTTCSYCAMMASVHKWKRRSDRTFLPWPPTLAEQNRRKKLGLEPLGGVEAVEARKAQLARRAAR